MLEREWLTPRQVAALTGYSPKTLSNWRHMNPQKGPKCFKVHGQYRYLRDDVREWMERQVKGCPATCQKYCGNCDMKEPF
ncbi:helix-turn-helix domain-containing protein [Nocardia vinacea]|uniref:helix-turn-helix domain-containing protein n=1 Tax=Nocardia vinacea TaxID=96468 RepID=UPI002E14AA4F|nr:helix-turn-helix domain-containing protein [Nocardia vinacea]